MTEKHFYRDLKVGILGGGQLGRMLIQAAIDFNIYVRVLDPDPLAPCHAIAHEFHQGSLTDYDVVYQFGQNCDVITIEIENVNTEALKALQEVGKIVYPDPQIIRMIQDKRKQKEFLAANGFPTSPFRLIDHKKELYQEGISFPAVFKLAREGYDGRGVWTVQTQDELEDIPDVEGVWEEFIVFHKELSVLVARNPQGEILSYPVVEMVFHPTKHLVSYLFSPAELHPKQAARVKELAHDIVEKLNYVGVMAIEMFLTPQDDVLVNEMSPRPHNSGHHTIRSCATSQFEQHLRAVLDMPLGATKMLYPAAMVNILGEDGFQGKARYEGIKDILKIAGVFPHLYGKIYTRPYRKMGHVTILDKDKQRLKQKINIVQERIKVISD